MNLKDIKIVFFGTPEFAVASLDALVKAGASVKAVVTAPDKPAGRGHKLLKSDVKKYAEANGLNLLQPTNLKDPEFISTLHSLDADLFIIIAFRMLPEAVWGMPPMGTVNLHASLLPKYRGAAPINRAIMNGETKSGVTTFFLKHEIDTGDIISQAEVDITPDDNCGTLHDKLMNLGASLVVKNVKAIAEGNIKTIPQPAGDFTPAPKIFRQDCEIDWDRPAIEIHNLGRGLSPYPAAKAAILESDGKEIEIRVLESAIAGNDEGGRLAPGDILLESSSMRVKCADRMLEITRIQPAGKKSMSVADYLLGHTPEKFILRK